MIYLFNSASRPLYTTNVLNTLHLPKGCTNEYRYRYSGDRVNINLANIDNFTNNSIGKEVVIIYIDRFAESGYKYYPLRNGKIDSVKDINDKLFFTVKLLEYLYTTNIESFNEKIKSSLSEFNIPTLTDGKPKNPDDGYYAIENKNILGQVETKIGDNFWTDIVESIKETKSFNSEEYDFVFSKCSRVRNNEKGKSIYIKKNDGAYAFEVKRDYKYEMRFSYIFPAQENDIDSRGKIEANFDENMRLLEKKEFNIDSYSNSFAIGFKSKKHIEEHLSSLSFSFQSIKPSKNLLGSNSKIKFKIKEPYSFWIQVIIALLIYSACQIVIGTSNFEKIGLSWLTFLDSLIGKGIAGFVQASVLFWLFKLFGKRIM